MIMAVCKNIGVFVLVLAISGVIEEAYGKIGRNGGRVSSNGNGAEETEEKLKQLIRQVDSGGLLRKLLKRRIHIPKHSSLTFTAQVSRPNIFPNIFNQAQGFIVDAVVEWPIWLDLHKFANAMFNDHSEDNDKDKDRSEPLELDFTEEPQDEYDEELGAESFRAQSISSIVGVERCLIYDKLETGMSLYLGITLNQSRDCMLRAVCEAQLIANYYPDAPSSVFFEVLHMILKPSLGTKDACHENYVSAEMAAHQAPEHCSTYVSRCPLNIAALFVRNFFPEIL